MTRLFPAVLIATLTCTLHPAAANEFCNKELAPLMEQQKSLNEKLTAIGKRSKEPGSREQFCGTMKVLIGTVTKFVTYLEQNKEFCAVPDGVIAQTKQRLGQNQTLRRKVCLASAQPQQSGGPGKPAIPRPPVELRLR
jgi:hypothetical protein